MTSWSVGVLIAALGVISRDYSSSGQCPAPGFQPKHPHPLPALPNHTGGSRKSTNGDRDYQRGRRSCCGGARKINKTSQTTFPQTGSSPVRWFLTGWDQSLVPRSHVAPLDNRKPEELNDGERVRWEMGNSKNHLIKYCK